MDHDRCAGPELRAAWILLIFAWEQCPDEGVDEPTRVLRLGPANLIAEHAGNIWAGEGPDDLTGSLCADGTRSGVRSLQETEPRVAGILVDAKGLSSRPQETRGLEPSPKSRAMLTSSSAIRSFIGKRVPIEIGSTRIQANAGCRGSANPRLGCPCRSRLSLGRSSADPKRAGQRFLTYGAAPRIQRSSTSARLMPSPL